MVLNILIDTAPEPHDQPEFLLSEYLSDSAAIHHETPRVDDGRYDEAVAEVQRLQVASVEFLRRHLKMDFAQATVAINRMEAEGIIQRTTYRSRDSRRYWRYAVVQR